jgi:hypothetical protein
MLCKKWADFLKTARIFILFDFSLQMNNYTSFLISTNKGKCRLCNTAQKCILKSTFTPNEEGNFQNLAYIISKLW